ncbi:hypothetical protein BD779DRAFT_478019 [Infundibulicybe gibba]|nr:hypothetical protein BD779DRAFT_478019 [Infundibulicybe gibba]
MDVGPENLMGIMSPPSPVMPVGGSPKDKEGKSPGEMQNGHPDGSLRGQGMGQAPGEEGETAPQTPVSNHRHHQERQGSMATPSPCSILDIPPPNMGSPPAVSSATSDLFSTDSIQSVAGSLDDFDPRDFEWFDHSSDASVTLSNILPPPPVPSATTNLFSEDFIQSVVNSLDDFERDFGQWFNHPNDLRFAWKGARPR